MFSNLDERLVHVLNDLSGNVGLELEVVVDLDGHVHVGRLQVLGQLVFYIVDQSLRGG